MLLGTITAQIRLENSQFLRGLDQVNAGVKGLDSGGSLTNIDSQINKAADSTVRFADKVNNLGEKLRNMGQKLTFGVTVPILGMGAVVVNSAANMEESINKVNVIFDEAAGTIIDFSEGSAKSMGLSQQATLDYTSAFAGMLGPIASSKGELASMSTELVTLTSDFASFHNLNPEEAFTVVQSALAGETEAIRRYGVDVSAAAVETKALQLGLAATTGELTEQDKALARYHLILEQTTEEQGDFARTSDSVSNKMKIMRARAKDAAVTFGGILLPAVSKILDFAGRLANAIESLDSTTRKWVVGIALGAAALGPLLVGLGFLLPVIAALLSPIGLVIVGVAALAAGVVIAYKQFETFRNILEPVVDFLGRLKDAWDASAPTSGVMNQINAWGGVTTTQMSLVDRAMAALDIATGGLITRIREMSALDLVISIGSWAINAIADLATSLFTWVRDVALPSVANFVARIPGILVNIGSWAKGIITDIWPSIQKWASAAWSAVQGMAHTIWGVLTNVGSWAKGIVSDIWPFIAQWAAAAWSAVQATAHTIWDVLIDVGSWAKGTWPDLNAWVQREVSLAWDGAADLGDIALTIGSINYTDLTTKLKTGLGLVFGGIFDAGALAGSLPTISGNIATWLTGQIEGVTWEGVGAKAGQLFAAAIKGAIALIVLGPVLVTQFTRGVFEGLLGVNWGNVASAFLNLFVAAIGALKGFAKGFAGALDAEFGQALGAVNWGKLAATIGNKLVAAIGSALNFAAAIGAALYNEFLGAVNGMKWGALATTIGVKLRDAIATTVNFAADLAKTLGAEFISAIGSVDWGAMGGKIKDYLLDATKGIGKAIWDAIWAEFGGDEPPTALDEIKPDRNDPESRTGTNLKGGGNFVIPSGLVDYTNSLKLARFESDLLKSATAFAFAGIKAAADTNLPPVSAAFGAAPLTWTAPTQAAMAGIKAAFQSTLPGLVTTTSTNFNALKTAGSTSMSSLKTSVGTETSTMSADAVRNVSGMNTKSALQAAFMKTSVSNSFMTMNGTVATQMDIMKIITTSAFTQMTTASRNAGTAISANMRNGATLAVNAVRTVLNQIPGIVSGIGNKAAFSAYASGANIGNSFAAGMRSALSAIRSAANSMVEAANGAVLAKAMIKSPSKLFMRLGAYTGEGYELGILGMIPDVARAMAALVNVPHPPAFGSSYAASLPNTSGGGYVDNRRYVGDITLTQAPGEQGEAFYRRFVRALNDDEFATNGAVQ